MPRFVADVSFCDGCLSFGRCFVSRGCCTLSRVSHFVLGVSFSGGKQRIMIISLSVGNFRTYPGDMEIKTLQSKLAYND